MSRKGREAAAFLAAGADRSRSDEMTSRRPSVRVLVLAALALGLATALACGGDPVGVDACRLIEGARCENANSCGIDLSKPVHRGDSPNLDVGACKRYYEDACLHGFVTTVEPAAGAVDDCVNVINDPTTSCEIIRNPEKHPACAFLIPPEAVPVPDAGTE
jgi:hypothetical protein